MPLSFPYPRTALKAPLLALTTLTRAVTAPEDFKPSVTTEPDSTMLVTLMIGRCAAPPPLSTLRGSDLDSTSSPFWSTAGTSSERKPGRPPLWKRGAEANHAASAGRGEPAPGAPITPPEWKLPTIIDPIFP